MKRQSVGFSAFSLPLPKKQTEALSPMEEWAKRVQEAVRQQPGRNFLLIMEEMLRFRPR